MADLFQKSGATISACGQYRYHLWRVWCEEAPIMCFVCQNPSTADADADDPTIRRCIGFATRDGFGGISVRNVFALRATDERELLTHPDPYGPDNDDHLLAAGQRSLMTRLVVAWGNEFGGKRLREKYVRAACILAPQGPYCLGTTKSGAPRHPLFLRADTELVHWKIPGS